MSHSVGVQVGCAVRAAIVGFCLAIPDVASTQEVSGVVRRQTDGAPVVGAIVILVSTDGEKLKGTLTADDGRFRLGAPAPGRYALRIDVVGYRSVLVPPFAVGAFAPVVHDVRFPFERVALPTIAVTTSSSCERVAGEGGDAARLWGEARKTLEATRIAQEERRFAVTVTRFERTLALPDSTVQTSRSFAQPGVSENPFVSLPPDSIAALGYLVRQRGRDFYFGPDARVLLSDQFVSSHCFSTRREGRPGSVGLSFRPAERSRRIDVEGVLWLDSASAELRSLDYRYVPLIGRNGRGGGTVEFGRLPSGLWGVTRWAIRMPVLRVVESSRRPDGILSRYVDTLITGVSEEGGEILTGLSGVPGSPATRTGTRVRGTVFDSTQDRALGDAVVTLEGAGRSVRSGSDGAFVFDTLSGAGNFRIRFWHPRLDSLGIAMPRATVRVAPGEEATVVLSVPGARDIARERCGEIVSAPVRIVAGTVRQRGTGGAPAGAEVMVLERLPAGLARDSSLRRASATARDNGRFALCRLSPGSDAWVVARAEGRWSPPLRVPSTGVAAIVDVELPAPESGPGADAAAVSERKGFIELARAPIAVEESRIEGWLLFTDEPPATPVQIVIDGAVASVATPSGHFRVERLGEGPRQVTFRAVGFGSVVASFTARRGESSLLLVTLERQTAVMTAVRTTSSRTATWNAGFEARRKRGDGVFLDQASLQKKGAQTLADILRGIPGIRVIAAGTGYRYQTALSSALSPTPSGAGSGLVTVAAPRHAATASGCDLTFVVDGSVFAVEEGNADLQLRPSEIAAIEVYASATSVPRQFAGPNAACGVIVIWRK